MNLLKELASLTANVESANAATAVRVKQSNKQQSYYPKHNAIENTIIGDKERMTTLARTRHNIDIPEASP